ncbi:MULTISPECIES: hypothetical protein [Mycobacterium]|uniref:Uncharacterized protein n=1 Tax=Mycobacterium kiyosense TaxID=2871094 RepID=A0A9P3Q7V2_9MYCO|nr:MULTISPECIES: hypothetical protein [Mycobacterium]BDB45229.1 hypothetical protein IWGMT90018_56750 [Mycobacterium kiyosense]BDE16702.1 hypothetical protein MKCMC460_55620 [Mycobacterium sp. 20KCMC460]GLB83966.1 hypothetical protein SRL2020028_32220 [Mycobacterium kiyosense]GLB90459.1 hypothetical protein SRL2020130_32760 [Mycobacterium kiyosense]GLB96326.1 hypothetical protein SRL2020226_31020 [Mycobacterium kiyosense]
MIRLITALLLTLAGLASACTATADTPTPTTEPRFADAARFPNMDSYTAANPDNYKTEYETPGRPGAKMTRYGFTTPDGIECGFEQSPSAGCTGIHFPSMPRALCDPSNQKFALYGISTNSGLQQYGDSKCDAPPAAKVLPPFHTLTVYGVTCGVDDKGTTACKDPQGQAFVLSPTWSGWIPKV